MISFLLSNLAYVGPVLLGAGLWLWRILSRRKLARVTAERDAARSEATAERHAREGAEAVVVAVEAQAERKAEGRTTAGEILARADAAPERPEREAARARVELVGVDKRRAADRVRRKIATPRRKP